MSIREKNAIISGNMAKKGARQIYALICSVCKRQNYAMVKNKINTPEKLTFDKYCPKCRKHTEHKESNKLK